MRRLKSIPLHLVLFFLTPVLLQFCAPVSVQPPAPPLGPHEIEDRVSGFRDQQDLVTTFFSSGRLEVKTRDSESEANALIIGTRDPFRIKIEITHRWGRHLLHILLNEKGLHIISFPERRYYSGPIDSLGSWKFFPSGLDRNHLWALVRGYPVLSKFTRTVSLKGGQITFLNGKDESLQVVDFDPQSHLPLLAAFPEIGISLHFSRYKKDGLIHYAQSVKLDDSRAETTLLLNSKQVIHNKSISEEIFELQIPSDYEKLTLVSPP